MVKIRCPTDSCQSAHETPEFDDAVELATHIVEKHPGYNPYIAYTDLLFKIAEKMDELQKEFVRSEAYAIDNASIRMEYYMTIEELKKLLGPCLVEHS
jgi:hypothetical protein